jgi:hypothetical protein
MSDESKTPEGVQENTPAPEDRLKNIQAEFGRKMGNLEETNRKLAQQLEAITAALKPSAPAPSEGKKVSVFDNEDEFARQIEERAEKRIEEKLTKRQMEQQRYAAVTNQLMSDFPELNDQNTALAKRANEIYMGLSADEKASPLALKAAVADAALELGVKPKSKRNSDSGDDFSLGSSGTSQANKSKRGESKLSQETLELAQLAGLDINDEKQMKRLEERAKRKNWKHYA